MANDAGFPLGVQAGQSKLRTVLAEGGLGNVGLATESPFNLVLEAKV